MQPHRDVIFRQPGVFRIGRAGAAGNGGTTGWTNRTGSEAVAGTSDEIKHTEPPGKVT
jgi:hypothetical protein